MRLTPEQEALRNYLASLYPGDEQGFLDAELQEMLKDNLPMDISEDHLKAADITGNYITNFTEK